MVVVVVWSLSSVAGMKNPHLPLCFPACVFIGDDHSIHFALSLSLSVSYNIAGHEQSWLKHKCISNQLLFRKNMYPAAQRLVESESERK